MKILSTNLTNFGSYKNLNFKFTNKGLTLLHGATGSGKSTFLDSITWCLFGVTAKNGTVDEIRTWNQREKTTGIIEIDVGNNNIKVCRIRGSAQENDLYWIENNNVYRGKDLNDTQKKIEGRLGISSDIYNTATYFNEFSETSLFFLAKAKERRELFEKIANLSLPKSLFEITVKRIKELKISLSETENITRKFKDQINFLQTTIIKTKDSRDRWSIEHDKTIEKFQKLSTTFEIDAQNKVAAIEKENKEFQDDYLRNRANILEILNSLTAEEDPICPTCGNSKYSEKLSLKKSYESQLKTLINQKQLYDKNYISRIRELHIAKNNYLDHICEEINKVNPFKEQLKTQNEELQVLEHLLDSNNVKTKDIKSEMLYVEQLNELSYSLRNLLLNNSISQVESCTNDYLERFFDSEFKVLFKINDSDNLDITIQKNGNQCSYSQLSKGQRQLLKLCFCVSIMKLSSSEIGMHFNTIFFDEPTDGCDTFLKLKAYSLFEELSLSHENVFIIDHNEEVKMLFNNKVEIKLNNEYTELV